MLQHIWATLVVCAQGKVEFSGPVVDLVADEEYGALPGDSDGHDSFGFDDDFEPEPIPRRNVVPIHRPWVAPSRWRSQVGGNCARR
ncbi:MAG: hypothetical protein ACXW5U_08155 [Thermoanaerobaculia bacterium]